jgi:ZIP family zinc transporter
MVLLICLEIVPEAYENATAFMDPVGAIFHVGLYFAAGCVGLKILDLFVPDHHDENAADKYAHIGAMACMALAIHNIIEGAAVYVSYVQSAAVGLLFAISVGLHNIPIGMMAAGSLQSAKTGRVKTWLLLFLLVVSSFVGGLVVHVWKIQLEGTLLASSLLAVSSGMLFYIMAFELAPEIKEHIKDKETYLGLLFGILLLAVGLSIFEQ